MTDEEEPEVYIRIKPEIWLPRVLEAHDALARAVDAPGMAPHRVELLRRAEAGSVMDPEKLLDGFVKEIVLMAGAYASVRQFAEQAVDALEERTVSATNANRARREYWQERARSLRAELNLSYAQLALKLTDERDRADREAGGWIPEAAAARRRWLDRVAPVPGRR